MCLCTISLLLLHPLFSFLPAQLHEDVVVKTNINGNSLLSPLTDNDKGMIGDRVWLDLNANGLQDTGEPGLKNVRVELTRHNGQTWETDTNANGEYLFTELVPGNYVVKFNTPAYYLPTPSHKGADSSKDSDAVNGEVTLYLNPHQEALNIDAGFIDDIDDDNDGILDLVEGKGYDALKDCDGDCIPNYGDKTPGCTTPLGNDVYGKRYQPLTWSDCPKPGCPEGDGINDFFDTDQDGVVDQLDLDSDNDGILDIMETRDSKACDADRNGIADGGDSDCDGLNNSADSKPTIVGGAGLLPADMDKDGVPNFTDLDSDGDGVSDLSEGNEEWDADGIAGGGDMDDDGIADTYDWIWGCGAVGLCAKDSDNDGKPNPYDIDSDNDGITDNVEAQPTCSYKIPKAQDVDADGVDDAYDIYLSCTRKAGGITPFDRDGDGNPDMYDRDTDNDNAPDVNEGSGKQGLFVTKTADTDGDGLIDEFDIFNMVTASVAFWKNVTHSDMGPLGSLHGPTPAGSNASLPQHATGNCSSGTDRDWRNLVVLPVTLIRFSGHLDGEQVLLKWTVENEINMKGYVVEKSVDGVGYATVKMIDATGSATAVSDYTLVDDVKNVHSPIVLYRLRMNGKDGTYSYSKVISIRKQTAIEGITIYPNPAVGIVNVKRTSSSSGQAQLRVMNIAGKLVFSEKVRLLAGVNILPVNLASLPAGSYTVQLVTEASVYHGKVVISR